MRAMVLRGIPGRLEQEILPVPWPGAGQQLLRMGEGVIVVEEAQT